MLSMLPSSQLSYCFQQELMSARMETEKIQTHIRIIVALYFAKIEGYAISELKSSQRVHKTVYIEITNF
mgnify:CR=1 FL=1